MFCSQKSCSYYEAIHILRRPAIMKILQIKIETSKVFFFSIKLTKKLLYLEFQFRRQQFQSMKTKKQEAKEQQLWKKLTNVKDVVQLKKISNNLSQQNDILRQDVLNLKYKVEVLLEKQKTKKQHQVKQDESKSKELSQCQKDLQFQYAIMQELKKRKDFHQQEKGTEELLVQHQNLLNELKKIEVELSTTRKESSDLKNQFNRLQQTMATNDEEIQRNQPKIATISHQNAQLRKKVLSMKKISVQKEYQSAKILNSMYTIKTVHSKNEQIFAQSARKKLSLKQEPSYDKQSILGLQKEVSQLKQRVKRKEKQQVYTQQLHNKGKQQLIQKNKEVVKNLKESEDRRNRLNNELNKYKKIWQRHLQMQANGKNSKEFKSIEVQALEWEDEEVMLRRDFAGILGGRVVFDDRAALRNNVKSFIIGFYVYELEHVVSAKNLLVGIRAIYDDAEASLANPVPLPGNYLSKCKMSKYVLVQGDFLKLFKVKYNSVENKILKLQIRTNKNNRYQFGDKRPFADILPSQNVYGFDISINEYPVSLFGSYNYQRSHWYMESLGVEINDL